MYIYVDIDTYICIKGGGGGGGERQAERASEKTRKREKANYIPPSSWREGNLSGYVGAQDPNQGGGEGGKHEVPVGRRV